MSPNKEFVSVPEAAALCGVSRSTVNNWIQAKRLFARRSGKSFSIPVADLLLLLRSIGKDIPLELTIAIDPRAMLGSLRPCFEYWEGRDPAMQCRDCAVFVNRLTPCFAVSWRKGRSAPQCAGQCHTCCYYQEVFFPRIQFVYQMDVPAAVFKNLYFLGVNDPWAEIWRRPREAFVGMDVEEVFHSESLKNVLSLVKSAEMKQTGSGPVTVSIGNETGALQRLTATGFSVSEPTGSLLVLLTRPDDDLEMQPRGKAPGSGAAEGPPADRAAWQENNQAKKAQ